MKRKTGFLHNIPVYCLVIIGMLTCSARVQGQDSRVFTSDVDHFWTAFDSVKTVNDTTRQIAFMQALYIDKATEGLRLFMKLRRFDAARLVTAINKYPKFWASIRENTLKIKPKIPAIEAHIREFKALYPDLRPAKLYFTITAVRAAGTVQDSLALIGTEIATGNKNTDVSEFPDKRLANFFQTQSTDNIIPVVVHEYVHTQQRSEAKILLGQALNEGACDFITELILKEPLMNSYLQYGRKNEKELKEAFKKEMLGEDFSNWLYNGSTTKTMGDLGYFMGYTICKSYYQQAKNKSQAIKDIITLNYGDQAAVVAFLEKSGYYDRM
ncbi:DUF2268 domain-containing putative Zn-dependent protease [Chitinophaga varians]|uniref:gliding motility protein GldB-related protein n=1 Tax=Chitinophaga varians TaxID=2202339 RepID=UPI00165FBBD1|nr:DUF2268 domain-containing putative Zn-dependent protease [Chitinophaga varians]MBC9913827.1 hypothetical protein [Chitinophaga varians]